MEILNLDQSFKPYGEGVDFKQFNFPSNCEVHVKLPEIKTEKIKITTRISSSDSLFLLFLASDALRRSGIKDIEVLIPYLPYARQDRVMVKGEPLSIKVLSDFINMQNYSKVEIYDPHSEVCLALINNAEAITNYDFVADVLKDKKDYFIASPDAGAYKKIFKLCQHLNYQEEIITCNKIRNVENGKIKSVTANKDNFEGKDIYIVDDICDGGGTFILLAQELKKRNCGKVNLIVSHGIFSHGEEALKPYVDCIYTTNSFKDIQSDYIKQFILKF
ncbi:MAG: ribose-phosphate diphosphokinase [Candidatus Sericytochromatia bacterium]